MVAVDTNVVVRLLVSDDARQTTAARKVFATGPVWISKTVLLETAWVLGSIYGIAKPDVEALLRKLLGLVNVEVEDPSVVVAALGLADNGMEFADAMHVSARPVGTMFVTFDRAMGRVAESVGLAGVEVLRG